MKKIEISQAVNTLANIGIILGLVFLVLELQQLRDQMDAQISYNLFMGRNDGIRTVATDEFLPEIISKVDAGENLSPVESFRINTFLRAFVFSWEYEWQQYQKGRYDDFDMQRIVYFFDTDLWGITGVWESMKDSPVLAEDFVLAVEQATAD
jgi:hypothetical protein